MPSARSSIATARERSIRIVPADRAVLLATLGNVANIAMGPVTVFLVASHIERHLQGFYYAFGSLLMLQTVADFGLDQTVMQLASHYSPQVSIDARGRVRGAESDVATMAQLFRIARKWVRAAIFILIPAVAIAGELVFGAAVHVQWRVPLMALLVGMVCNVFLAPLWALIQGCNRITDYWTFRLGQQLVNGAVLWGALVAGADLWSIPLASGAVALWGAGFLKARFPDLVASLSARATASAELTWRKDVWPLQWRIALAWMGTYLSGALFVPVLFRAAGPVAAGQLGMTNAVGAVLMALSLNVVVTKAPVFGAMVARREYVALTATFSRALRVTLLICGAGSAAGVVVIIAIQRAVPAFAGRLLPDAAAAAYMGFTVAWTASAALGVYVRAFRRELLAPAYAASLSLIVVCGAVAATRAGVLGFVGTALVVALCVQLPAAVWAFRKQRNAAAHLAQES